MKIKYKKILKIVKEKMYGESTGHDYFHVLRVLENAKKISFEEIKKTKINFEIVELACLLHDIADHKFFAGSEKGAENFVKNILEKQRIKSDTISEVLAIIRNMSWKGGVNENKKLSPEGKIVRDADRLDAMGAIGIARAFATGNYFKRMICDPENKKTPTTINHFYEKLLLLKKLMLTKTGKKMAHKKHKYMDNFLKQLYAEVK